MGRRKEAASGCEERLGPSCVPNGRWFPVAMMETARRLHGAVFRLGCFS